MTVIGLTGGIACGKTTVAGYLRDLGAAVIDADAISRSLTVPGGAALPAIFTAFGEGVRGPNDTLDRSALAERVFGDESALNTLNRVLHPLIEERMLRAMEECREAGTPVVVLDIPLLYEAGMDRLADAVWCVSVPEDVQLQRLRARDGLNREQALRRIRSQWPLSEKEQRADAVISTHRPEAEVQAQAALLYRGAMERSRQ